MKLKAIAEMIKIEHTLFAMPFLYSGAVLAANGIPSISVLFWITLGLFSARTAAMTLNRIIDREIDALNPRTRDRHLVTGEISVKEAWTIVFISLAILLVCAAMLNPLTLKLYPLAVAIIWLYPYTKRFTWLSHLILGMALSLAPAGAWAAVRASLDPPALILAMAVIFWVAGFDIIYALQDVEFDRAHNLHSIPAKFGIGRALAISSAFHGLMALLLFALYFITPLDGIYIAGVGIIIALLIYEHMLVGSGDLSKVGVAFFNVNALISFVLFLSIVLDVFLTG